jgi:hypothetical protein
VISPPIRKAARKAVAQKMPSGASSAIRAPLPAPVASSARASLALRRLSSA